MAGLRLFTSKFNWLASIALAGFVFLLPAKNVEAAANLSFSTAFVPVEAARNTPAVPTAYMTQAGTWNGTTEVTNSLTNGDRFTLVVSNTGVGVTDALNVVITVTLPSGFRLPNTTSTPVTVASSAGCLATAGAIRGDPVNLPSNILNASQSLLTVNFNIPTNADTIPAGCTYTFEFGLTTRNSSPFPVGGTNNIIYNLAYDNVGPVAATPATTVQQVLVRTAALALTKTALTPVATNGSTVDFSIDIRNPLDTSNPQDTGGGAFRVTLTDTFSLPTNFSNLVFVSYRAFNDTTGVEITPLPAYLIPTVVSANQRRVVYLPPDVRLEFIVRADVNVTPTATTCPVLVNDAIATQRGPQTSSHFASVDYNLPDALQLTHDLTNSYCELCGVGEIRLTAANAGGITLENISVTEELLASGLVYVPDSTRVSINGGPITALPGVNPAPAPPPAVNGLVWSLNAIYAALSLPSTPAQMDSPYDTTPTNPVSVQIIFQVQRNPGAEESLIGAVRNIRASAEYDLVCGGLTQNTTGIDVELPIRQPIPITTKLGRNVDAGQNAGNYTPIVYGHVDDDVIWRIEIQNTGLAGLQDLRLDDVITGSNFDINYICSTEASATAAASVVGTVVPPIAGCDFAGGGNVTSILNHAIDDPFGSPPNDQPTTYIDVSAGSSAFIYYVGRIRRQCNNQTNRASDVQWGCEVNFPDGGITAPATTGGVLPAYSVADPAVGSNNLHTSIAGAGLDVTVAMDGSNQAQPLGTKGIVTITIANNSGGTMRLWDGVADYSLRDVLPAQYVMDTTFPVTAVMAPAYGNNYLGMVDTIQHSNLQVNPLANTAPEFVLSSTTDYTETIDNNPGFGTETYSNLIRNGDVLTVQFGVVLIDSTRYDFVADLNDVEEDIASGTDPNNSFNVNNSIDYFAYSYPNCSVNTHPTLNGTFPANPEDLDVNTSSALYILTNDPGTPLDLTTLVTNNGGHDADDYWVYITFGEAMTVQLPLPAGCAATSNPPPQPVWNQPAFIPTSASVYRCYRGVIAPGATQNITFQVIRNAIAGDDDLTFRADVVGEITLSDGTPLTFPAPASIANTTPAQQLANNYSLDGIRSRVLGFNLTKEQSTTCTEDPLSAIPVNARTLDSQVRIGEDCDYFIHAGGWFGFDTPGFTLISVQDMLITDALPNGQGFINTDDGSTSDLDSNAICTIADGVDGLCNITKIPAVLPALTEGDVAWSFNQGNEQALTEKDKFFNLNMASRLLNDSVDPLYQPTPPPVTPNVHAATSTNIAHASFNANYESAGVTSTFCVSDTTNVPSPGCIVPPGYPVEAVRRIDLTVTEPNLIVTKEVCNETLSVTKGANCSLFVTDLDTPAEGQGDTQDMYVYRVAITNEAASGGIARAPAFNVDVTDVLDSSDMMLIDYNRSTGNQAAPFDSDGLDNDGDGLVDTVANGGNDTDGEFSSLTENVANGGVPATFVISNTHSVPLQRIDAGSTVTFYYRIDPDDAVAPQQILSNTVSTVYDSLEGDSGNQHAPQLTNAENTAPNNSGRARIYDAFDDAASIQILPLQTQPKAVIQVSNSPYTGSPQNVVVGEEIKYELYAQIPVANLRNFVVRDELPPGMRCVEGQTIDLDAAPYDAAGFSPGGSFAATCTSTGVNDVVQWNFGNQQLTAAANNNLFDFRAYFIARVENSTTTQEACNIRNGGSTGAGAVAAPVACGTDPTLARLTYTNESSTTVTLNYGSADVVVREPVVTVTKSFAPVVNADADDILTVTVTATNSGTAPAYNLQILDNLVGTTMTYVAASVGGTTPPDNVDVATLGANQPIFNWDVLASAGYALDAGETISFTFQVQVDATAQPHEILNNTIQARWTSLPSVNTALNSLNPPFSARTIAADGDVLGMRDGQLTGTIPVAPVSLNPPNDYNTTATASVVVPELTVTKTDLNLATPPAIGEHKQFQIVITLPEGVTNGVIVTDNLASGVSGVSYVLENNATYDITYSFQDIATINGDAPSEAAFLAGIADPNDGFPIDNSSGTVTWNIGAVDTVSENDSSVNAVNPQIIITYYARINNDVDTDVGDVLQNGATLNYTNGETAGTEVRTDNTAAVTVIEPLLTVNKVWSNVTPGKALGDQPDAGDILEYEVTIDNTGNATAFDINIKDTIPVWVQLDGTFTATATINAVAVAGFVAVPLNSPTGPLIWGRGNADETLDLPASDTLLLTYRVIVQDTVETSQAIINSVVIDWTSLNGVDSLERNGGIPVADCSAIVAPDDYCAGPATATATVPNPNDITKVASVSNLRIGDTVQYTLTFNLQEGTTRNLSMVDTLPNGMELVSIDSVDGDTTPVYSQSGSGDNIAVSPFTHADIAAPVVTTGAGANTITWAIGDVVNVADNNTANDNFVIVYTARVVNDEIEPVQQVAPTNPQETLTNAANAAFYDVASATVNINDTASIVAQEPIIALANISKERRSNADHNITVASGTSVASGEIMHFHLNACNTGNGPAYDVEINDDLEYPLLSGTISILNVYVNGLPTTAYTYVLTPFVTTTTGATVANMNFVFDGVAVNPVTSAPNNCILVEYAVQVEPTYALTNQSWDNNYQVTQYHSLPATDPAANVAERETWGPVGPVVFNMNNFSATNTFTLLKNLLTPVSHEATVGETITYQITVPGAPLTVAHNDVTLADNLDDSLVFVSASLDAASTCGAGGDVCAITSTTGAGTDQVGVVVGLIEAGERAVINVVAQVANNPVAQNSLASFGNTTSYTFAASPGGSPIIGATGSTNPADNISIVEPQLTLATKTVANITNPGNPPDAGDVLRYSLTINAAGGATFSDAFDVSIIDTLGLGLLYSGNPTVSNSGAYTNSIAAPDTNAGDGVATQQQLTWSLTAATPSNINITEGDAVIVTYDVVVLNSVLANQTLSNSALIQWTGINGDYAGVERDGTNTIAAQGGLNDYFSGPVVSNIVTPNNNTITKTRASDTYNTLANDVRVGDVITYQLDLNLQEGLQTSLMVNDVLPQGLVFVGIQSINGDSNGADDYAAAAPFSYTSIPAGNITVSGDPATGPSTLSINMGDVTNSGDNVSNNTLSIIYTARVLNNDVHPQVNNIALQNSAAIDYTTATGAVTSAASTALLDLRQPTLTVTKTATQEFGDTIVVAGENITYTVTIANTGTAPAYDMVLRDTLPFGMRIAGVTTTSIETPIGSALATFAPTYDGVTGIAEWNFDNAAIADTYTIQPGQSLRIVYTAVVDATVGAGVTLNNSAQVQLYYSFDDDAVPATAVVTDREVYGPTAASVYAMTTPAPSPLDKQNPANTNASIGEPFTYRITVPATPVATALYDVRILDDLSALAPNVDLIFVDVQKPNVPANASTTWVPVNTGTDASLIIEDTTTGIDIPAGEQVVIDIMVVARNTSNNSDGDVFQNTASYTYDSVNDDAASQGLGGGATTTNMTIVEPLTMVLNKTAPVNMQYGVPGTFTIDVQNTGNGPAYDLTITDHLPAPVTGGGMCATAPDNFTAETRDAANVLQQTLTAGVDFTTVFTTGTTLGTIPGCTLVITMQSANAVMQSGWHLVVNYDAHLDTDNVNGAILTNYAAATQWFSADTPAGQAVGEIREYPLSTDPNAGFDLTNLGTDTINDDEDLAYTTVAAPELEIIKSVYNIATNLYANTAEAGDTLRYEISIRNIGTVAATNFSLSDEIDRLNLIPGFFVAGSLSPGTVIVTNTDSDGVYTLTVNPVGGTQGTGQIDITGLDLTEAGGADDTFIITFEATLLPVIDSGNVIKNQAEVTLTGFSTLVSDDPSSTVADDPTQTIVGSSPLFQTYKISDDVTGDPIVLNRGDVLVYTLTMKNIGAEDAAIALLHDQIPANTTYVPNTTTLNSVFIDDPAQGVSPLEAGMPINAPGAASGFMRADADPLDTSNIATVTFNVMVNDNVINGTVISNQAFVSGEGIGGAGFAEQLSDDPDTEIVGDPTRDIVGNVAILDAQKTVTQITDLNANELLDAGDAIRYTIVIHNSGLIDATGVVITDSLPANTTYVANSLLVNTLPVGQPDGGVLPLAAGIDVSSSNLTPPVQGSGLGTVSAGETVTLTFDVTVAAGTPNGTVISNQGDLTSNEYPDEMTDADGNDINGDEPTLITVGSTQQLTITKNVFVVGGGTAQPGDQLEYLITVTNSGNTAIDLRNRVPNPLYPAPGEPFYIDNPNTEVLKVFDDIDQPGLISYVSGSKRLNGVDDPNLVYIAPRIIANFDDGKRSLSNFYQFRPGDSFTVRYLAQIEANAMQGADIINTAAVDWGVQSFAPVNSTTVIDCPGGSQNVDACATSSLAVGGAPGVATLSGKAWHDSNFDLDNQTTERALAGWEVQIYFGNGDVNPGDYLDSVLTDVNGNFSISGLVPNASDTKLYALRFLAPGASTDTASLGNADSIYTDGPQQITLFDVANSSHTVAMNLPIQPNGVVYNAVTRNGVPGARLELFNASGVSVPASCFVDPIQQNQRTVADGYYKFELNFSDALCPPASDYTIHVYPPVGYRDYDNNPATDEISRIIPPFLPLTDPGYDVATCTGDATGATPQCEVQTSEFAPPTSEAPRTTPTNYYLKVNVQNFPADDQLYNNHLPIDPELDSALAISKTSALVNVTRSQLVPYTITVTNTLGAPIFDIDIEDDYPAGFKYVAGSSRIYVNNIRVTNRAEEPVSLVQGDQGRSLTWPNFTIYENDVITIKMLLVVGAGVGEGEYVNLAHALNNLTLGNASGEASATVRVVPDPTFDCSDIIGKVFNDKNLNGYADEGEAGIAGVRVTTAQGLQATTDEYGRYHFTCAVVPNQDRGSNFIVKLDERSLPTGYRVTSENPRTQRATRGKMLKYNFGAAIHHVVRLDMMDAVFKPGTTEIRVQWLSRLDMLMSELAKDQAVLRLSYLAENEDKSLVDDRLDAVKAIIEKRWADLNCCYRLMIETEVFWRKGGPVDKGALE
jgi:uncharacterized repeat protein (TIGR01451 family)/fimbrial isopeptide formation D2 family protein